MKRVILYFSFLSLMVNGVAQNVGIGTTSPDASAQLDVSSTTKGFLPPRMTTTQRDAIPTPANGLVIFNTTTNSIQLKISSGWVPLTTPATAAVYLPTIVIGTQQWMNKNLDVAFYQNGDPIPQVTDDATWATLTTGAWCYYNNDSTLGNSFGKLYNWYAVNDPRGLAPQGWHIPSDAEWTSLATALGGEAVAGGKMKEAGTLNWASPNTGGNNNSGFTSLPGGFRQGGGAFALFGLWSSWWSTTPDVNNINMIWGRFIFDSDVNLGRGLTDKSMGYGVRCVRD
jgi:uncharacterized protein (TIGR02145 family)